MNALLKKYGFTFASAALFLVLLVLVFRAFIFDSNTLMLNSDQLNGLGSRILRAENAILTEWDDSRLGGLPTVDATFSDAYHPLVLMQFITDPARAVGFKFILTLWIAFISAMLLARNLTHSDWLGALLGFLYALSPQFFTYIYGGHDGKMMVFSIAPLAILAIRKIMRNGHIPSVFLLVFCIVWMVLGSHLQLTYLFLWGAGLYALYEMFFTKAPLKTRGFRLLLSAIALTFGLCISSFQIIPPYIYTTEQSVRGTGEKTNYGHAVSWSLHQEELGDLLIPGFLGVDVYEQDREKEKIEGSSLLSFNTSELRGLNGSPFYWGHNPFKLNHDSSGAILTFLAFLCFFIPGKRRYATFWFLGIAIALSYAMGAHSPLFSLWFEILPGVKNFRAPSMSLFWLPLMALMMASPVLAARGDKEKTKHLGKGAFLFGVLLIITTIARFYWTSFLSAFGLCIAILYGLLFIATLNLADNDKKLSLSNILGAVFSGFKGSSKISLILSFLPFFLIGIFMLSGQELINNPITAPYFKPLNLAVMNMSASKMLPSLFIVVILSALTYALLRKNIASKVFVLILVIAGGLELYFINSVFVQNVNYSDYIQLKNNLVQIYKQQYKNDSLSTPRVLSLSRNSALTGNVFPAYNLRNADGFHDNELSSYRNFRGGQNNENYFIGLTENGGARPFLDVANIGAVIYDTKRTTTYIQNPTALGEAFLYGNVVVKNDSEAIELLKKGAIRQENTEDLATDSLKDDVFYYRETVILSEAPQITLNGTIPQGYAKLVKREKMDEKTFEVKSNSPAILFISGNYHPYWNATVNGKSSKVYKAFGTFCAVEVPKGQSTVHMEYRSKPFHKCLYVSFAAFLVLVLLGVSYIIKQNKSKRIKV